MKKISSMRVATIVLALVLVTSCFVGGTFAKYTSSISGEDSARVAYWGFGKTASIEIATLFDYADQGVLGNNNVTGLIAPGTSNAKTFDFEWDASTYATTAPEVDYVFTVAATGTCDDAIKNNANIVWKLDNTPAPAVLNPDSSVKFAAGSFDALLEAIKGLSGDESGVASYEAGNLPVAFKDVDSHSVGWAWEFHTDDPHDKNVDTVMGNSDDALNVNITISITATQLDEYTPAP